MSLRNMLSGSFLANQERRGHASKRRSAALRCNLRLEPLEARRLMVVNAANVRPAEIAPGEGFDGVVNLYGCTGSLLGTRRHILTAAHCIDRPPGDGQVDGAQWVGFDLPGATPGTTRTVDVQVPVGNIAVPRLGGTDSWDGVFNHGSDIAILELPELAPHNAEDWDIYRGTAEEQAPVVSFLGYGATNARGSFAQVLDGSFGGYCRDPLLRINPCPATNSGVKRRGFNHIDDADARLGGTTVFDEYLHFDLDNPAGATPGVAGEAMSAPGDSGGPMFIPVQIGNEIVQQIAGVSSGANADISDTSPIASIWERPADYTRVSRFQNWIDQTLDNDYDLVINMVHQRSVGGGDGAADLIQLVSTKNLGNDVVSVIVNGTTIFEEQLSNRIKSVKVLGSTDNESVWIESGVGSLWRKVVTVEGGGGIDTLTIDDSLLVDDPLVSHDVPDLIRLDTSSIDRPTGVFPFENPHKVHVKDLDGLNYLAAAGTVVYDIQGSPWMGAGQTTLYTSPTLNDTITVHPRDFVGNPTILGRIGIFGGDEGGSQDDRLYIDDSLVGISGAIWNVENPHGAATQSFSVAGGDTIGAYVDVEKVILRGSQRDDEFNIQSYQNGSSLEVEGLGGSDTLNVTPTSGNASASIKWMSYFSFDGGDNADHFNFFNASNNNRWAYTRTSTYLQAQELDTGYGGMIINIAGVTWFNLLAGSQPDQFVVEATPLQHGEVTEMDGGGGADNYTVRPPSGALNLQNIRGPVRFHGDGSDALLIDDRNDPVGRTYHIGATEVGNVGGDNLFNSSAHVEFLGTFQFLQVLTGHGVDIAHVDPHATTPLEIVAGDPQAAPGDALFLNVADAVNPQLNQINPSTGVYTFDNRASVTYVGVEQRQSVVIKPDHDLDGVPDLVEDAAPGGDGNLDGIPDSQQTNVASLPSLTGAYVTLVAEPGLILGNVNVIANPAPANAPAGVEFPLGFFDFRVLDLNPGEATTVTLILPQGMAATSYWKYGKTPENATDHWYEFTNDGSTGASFAQGGKVVSLHFVDGQRGDDALRVDGRIVDPGGPGISTVCQVPGDTNSDCAVNVADLNNVRNHFGETGDAVLGDTNGDRKVDVADLNNVRNYFGTAPGAPAPISVPSPIASFALAPRAVDTILADLLSSNDAFHDNLSSRSRRLTRRAMLAASSAAMPDDVNFPKVAQAQLQLTPGGSGLTSRPLGS